MTEHQPQFPQPLELPIDERESPLGLRAQLVRFVITGGLSAIVDFGLLVILMHGFFGFDGLGHTPAKALSFIQVDCTRVAGVSEFLTVSFLAKIFDLPVVPHVGDMGQMHQQMVGGHDMMMKK